MPVLNANTRAFNLHTESLKSRDLYFVAHSCMCISFLLEEWKLYAKPDPQLLLHFSMCGYASRTLHLGLLVSKEGLKGKEP